VGFLAKQQQIRILEERDDLAGQRLWTFRVDRVPGVVEEERVAVDLRFRQFGRQLCCVPEDVSWLDVVVRSGAPQDSRLEVLDGRVAPAPHEFLEADSPMPSAKLARVGLAPSEPGLP